MSPLSDKLERLAELHGLDVLWVQEFWLERAAIREYDGNIPRHRAEQLALRDVEDEMEGRHVPPDATGGAQAQDTASPVPQDPGSRTGQSDAPGEVGR